ncbi:unnamed protein product [Calypogeia fissa]
MRSGGFQSAMVFLLGLLLFGAVVQSANAMETEWKSKVPAMFIFGDSLVDSGNNNYIKGSPQANFVPYGETFFHNATGRWCNGRLIFDFIAEYLSLPFPKPYFMPGSDPTRFKRGVNFGSASSGILDSTFVWEGVINLSVQVKYYLNAIAELKGALGEDKTCQILSESLFVFVTGNNDVSEYVSNTTLQAQYSVEQFVALLVSKLSTDIQTVMDTGARKIIVGGMGPLGCVPRALASIGSKGPCLEILNNISRQVDASLLAYVKKMNAKMNTSNVILTTSYKLAYTITENGTSLGFETGNTACCGSGLYDGGTPDCGVGNYTLCKDVDKYAYWDFVHLTERAYHIIADSLWTGDTSTVYPVNIKQLAAS